MSIPTLPTAPTAHPLFRIVVQRLDETSTGSFHPGAFVEIMPALRTSGLLQILPVNDLKSLLLVLTFVHPNGYIQPSLLELSQAFGEPQFRTRSRMGRLVRAHFQGMPILHEIRRENGLHAYTPAPNIVATVQAASPSPEPADLPSSSRPAGRAAILARSRATYAHSRDEVERDIARFHGWPWPFRSIGETLDDLREQALIAADPPPELPLNQHKSLTTTPMTTHLTEERTTSLLQQLLLIGVSHLEAEDLLARFDTERIQRQLHWLPFRKANSPSRLLVAAIEADYEVPAALRHLSGHSGQPAASNDADEYDPSANLPLP